ncbi:UDP-N-acetylmuramyl pentapeptide phosphotransferase/UDP-N-acetylglucosamine-1-phosphate transferase [Bacilli bacterium PM5-3]|nr:UDP-N-acetylmuramyl pentapeptide phosphotransferase/UDP-N-acetylglucosamine-1-phosphate transferase [Bacilli bacterium PM5-3]MDH6604303.1 UDP-N-acetylmuramyl pentapeptide phosphotransferase/UDP-N-acetylglucosamine-1-phosphate transferase [Bacilli bacterium PM5-9]
MELSYILGFFLVYAISFILTPIAAKVSMKLYIVAWPGERHIHKKITPRMGGLAIYSAFLIGCMLFVKGDQQIMALLLGGFVIGVCGVMDDLTELSAKVKLAFQIVATLIVVFYGQIRIDHINIPGGFVIDFGALSTIITILWIIGITNAVNLIDGMDGLCAGVSSIILATFAMISYMQGREDIVLISILLLAAVIGFLFHNFYPASIFMGDTGSLFIGYMIATLSLLGFKSSAFLTLGPAIFILAIPILDTFLSIIRRKIKGVAIMAPDKEHLHHTLMYKLNLSQVKTVMVIYGVTFYFSQVSFAYLIDKKIAFYMLIIAFIVIELFIEKTGMISKKYRPILNIYDFVKSLFIKESK